VLTSLPTKGWGETAYLFENEYVIKKPSPIRSGTGALLMGVVSAYQVKIELLQKDSCYRPECCIIVVLDS
jgi:hypothetical protein